MDNRVVLDSDFCNMLAPGENIEREKALFHNIFEALELKPVLHIFVFSQELLNNLVIKDLVSEQFIEVLDYSDFIPDDLFKKQYVETFADFYNYMNGEAIDNTFETVTRHCAHKNMGEIHSLIMAHYLSLPVFMSNDNGAKNLAKSKINTQAFIITVKNVCEVFCELKQKGILTIKRKSVRAILKKRPNWLNIYDNCDFENRKE